MTVEIYHHGVKGQKWGVRRDAKMLGGHKLNAYSAKVKQAYKSGEISKKERNSLIKSKKKDIKLNTTNSIKRYNSMDKEKQKEYASKMRRQVEIKIPGERVYRKQKAYVKREAVSTSLLGAAFTGMTFALGGPAAALPMAALAVTTNSIHAGYRYYQSKQLDKIL